MLAIMATVLIPIPDTDFDPTEVAVSWQVLTARCSQELDFFERGPQCAIAPFDL